MPKVTYLFGAGASAEALPVVAKIPDKLAEFKEIVQNLQWEKRFDEFPNITPLQAGGFEYREKRSC